MYFQTTPQTAPIITYLGTIIYNIILMLTLFVWHIFKINVELIKYLTYEFNKTICISVWFKQFKNYA